MKNKIQLLIFLAGLLLAWPVLAQQKIHTYKKPHALLNYKTVLPDIEKSKQHSSHQQNVVIVEPEYDSIYHWSWDITTANWALSKKTIDFSYDSQSNLTGNHDQNYFAGTWLNERLYTATFDGNNNPLTITTKTWNGIAWENDEQTTSTYNSNDQVISETKQIGNGSSWENLTRSEHTYDANSNITAKLLQSWKGSAWENKEHYVLTYDASNHLTQETDQSWNGTGWENKDRFTYTYDANGGLLTELDETWNSGQWRNFYYYTFGFDAKKNLTNLLIQVWQNATWENSIKGVFTYNTSNLPESNIAYLWNDISKAWEEMVRTASQYSVSNKLIRETTEQYDGSNWVYATQKKQWYDVNDDLIAKADRTWNSNGTSIESGDSTYYFIRDGITNIAELNASKNISIYPNPAQGTFNVLLTNRCSVSLVEVYNALGEKIMEQQQTSTLTIPNATKGIYYIRVFDGKNVYKEKLIVQ